MSSLLDVKKSQAPRCSLELEDDKGNAEPCGRVMIQVGGPEGFWVCSECDKIEVVD